MAAGASLNPKVLAVLVVPAVPVMAQAIVAVLKMATALVVKVFQSAQNVKMECVQNTRTRRLGVKSSQRFWFPFKSFKLRILSTQQQRGS